jgi:hypothetical protein
MALNLTPFIYYKLDTQKSGGSSYVGLWNQKYIRITESLLMFQMILLEAIEISSKIYKNNRITFNVPNDIIRSNRNFLLS